MCPLENPFFRGGVVVKKKQYVEGNCLKRGPGQFVDLREETWQKEGNALYVDY